MQRGLANLRSTPKTDRTDLARQIGVKFKAWETALLREDSLNLMVPLSSQKRKLVNRELADKSRYIDDFRSAFITRLIAGEPEYQKQLVAKELVRHDARYNYDKMRETAEENAQMEFVKQFIDWLQGKGPNRLHDRTPWGREKPALELKEVRSYLEGFLDVFYKTWLKLTLLVFRGPQTLNEYWIYYKYVLHPEDWPNEDPLYFMEIGSFFDREFKANFLDSAPMERDDPRVNLKAAANLFNIKPRKDDPDDPIEVVALQERKAAQLRLELDAKNLNEEIIKQLRANNDAQVDKLVEQLNHVMAQQVALGQRSLVVSEETKRLAEEAERRAREEDERRKREEEERKRDEERKRQLEAEEAKFEIERLEQKKAEREAREAEKLTRKEQQKQAEELRRQKESEFKRAEKEKRTQIKLRQLDAIEARQGQQLRQMEEQFRARLESIKGEDYAQKARLQAEHQEAVKSMLKEFADTQAQQRRASQDMLNESRSIVMEGIRSIQDSVRAFSLNARELQAKETDFTRRIEVSQSRLNTLDVATASPQQVEQITQEVAALTTARRLIEEQQKVANEERARAEARLKEQNDQLARIEAESKQLRADLKTIVDIQVESVQKSANTEALMQRALAIGQQKEQEQTERRAVKQQQREFEAQAKAERRATKAQTQQAIYDAVGQAINAASGSREEAQATAQSIQNLTAEALQGMQKMSSAQLSEALAVHKQSLDQLSQVAQSKFNVDPEDARQLFGQLDVFSGLNEQLVKGTQLTGELQSSVGQVLQKLEEFKNQNQLSTQQTIEAIQSKESPEVENFSDQLTSVSTQLLAQIREANEREQALETEARAVFADKERQIAEANQRIAQLEAELTQARSFVPQFTEPAPTPAPMAMEVDQPKRKEIEAEVSAAKKGKPVRGKKEQELMAERAAPPAPARPMLPEEQGVMNDMNARIAAKERVDPAFAALPQEEKLPIVAKEFLAENDEARRRREQIEAALELEKESFENKVAEQYQREFNAPTIPQAAPAPVPEPEKIGAPVRGKKEEELMKGKPVRGAKEVELMQEREEASEKGKPVRGRAEEKAVEVEREKSPAKKPRVPSVKHKPRAKEKFEFTQPTTPTALPASTPTTATSIASALASVQVPTFTAKPKTGEQMQSEKAKVQKQLKQTSQIKKAKTALKPEAPLSNKKLAREALNAIQKAEARNEKLKELRAALPQKKEKESVEAGYTTEAEAKTRAEEEAFRVIANEFGVSTAKGAWKPSTPQQMAIAQQMPATIMKLPEAERTKYIKDVLKLYEAALAQ